MRHSQKIRVERHERVSGQIQRDASVLIERWARRVLEEKADAQRLHHDVLLDDLPAFLEALGESLGEANSARVGVHQAPAVRHGEQRWENGWSLPEMIRDYQLLRTVVLEYLDETLSLPLQIREILALNLAFDEAIAASVGMYVASREEAVRHAERERVERERQAEADKLRQQAKTLREIDRRKDEFLGVLGHELRNPLAPIRNVLQVLQLRPPDADTLKWSREVVERQVRQMTRLVDDLLDITRIGQGKVQLRLEKLDFVQIVRTAAQDRCATLHDAGLTCVLELPDVPLLVKADADRLGQIVGNLLHNAGKFTSAGGTITVHVTADADGKRVRLTVRDTGIGIDAADLPHLFESYRQAERARHRSEGGLGLGLGLVKGLVELHGGSVRAESAGLGHGAAFSVWLPLAT